MNCKQLAKDQEITKEDIFDFSAEMIQRLLYLCQFCNFYSVKDLWGPGRIWCPTCKKRQMSTAELLEYKYRSVWFNEINN